MEIALPQLISTNLIEIVIDKYDNVILIFFFIVELAHDGEMHSIFIFTRASHTYAINDCYMHQQFNYTLTHINAISMWEGKRSRETFHHIARWGLPQNVTNFPFKFSTIAASYMQTLSALRQSRQRTVPKIW